MKIGLGLTQGIDGKHYVMLQAAEDNIGVNISITGEENYEHDIDALIEGLQQMKTDMRHAISGLLISREVPDAIRAQGGKLHSTGRASTKGPRTSAR